MGKREEFAGATRRFSDAPPPGLWQGVVMSAAPDSPPEAHPPRWLVDGFSLLYRWRPGPYTEATAMRAARETLIDRLREWQSWLGAPLTAVFDGRTDVPAEPRPAGGFQVVYTRGESADTWIERHVLEDGRPLGLVVVSSDLKVLHTVAARGAQALTCESFLARVKPLESAVRQARRGRPSPRPYPPRLGDFFPPPPR
jgi:predicted RNA-binding protein with PIN domain